MKDLINYILQFGELNKQETDFILSKAELLELSKKAYFPKQVKFSDMLDLYWRE